MGRRVNYKYIVEKATVVFVLVVFNAIHAFSQCPDVNLNFNANNTSFCGSGSHDVILTNNSTGLDADSIEYNWLLDGILQETTNELDNPNPFTFSSFGEFTISLVNVETTLSCQDTIHTTVNVVEQPEADFTFSPNNECGQSPVSFNPTGGGLTGNTNYSWDFGDGNTSNNASPTHEYQQGGSYTVTLTVDNGFGCTDTYSEVVEVLDVPQTTIFGDSGNGTTTVCLLPGDPTSTLTVDFFNLTTGATLYHWDFGDGNTSTDAEPTHTYTSYGTFQVILTATGPNGCEVYDTIEVVFERFVSASMNLDGQDYSGCAPHELTSLQNLSNNANQYVWDFGDGTPPVTTTNPTPPNHEYNDAGTYTVSLTASNNCNSATATISPIVIVDSPETDFDFNMANGGCAPETISFTNNTTGAQPMNNFEWDMGNGNVYTNVVTPPDQTYTNAGTYEISLTASNACGDETITETIELDTIPIAIVDADPIETCSPATIEVENNSLGNINNYNWTINGAYHSNNEDIGPFNYNLAPGNTPETYTYTLTVSNQCGSSTDDVTVTINRPTEADFTVNTTETCLGTAINITNNSLGQNLDFEWDYGDGTSSTNPGNHIITYADTGEYTIQLIADGLCGPDTITQTVEVLPLLDANFDFLLPNDGCSPVEVEVENNSTGPDLNFEWDLDGTVISNNQEPNPFTLTEPPGNNPVEYILTMNATSACGNEEISDTITVHPPTLADFDVSPNEICLGDAVVVTDNSLGENLSVEYDFGDGTNANTVGPHTINYAAAGIYDIELIAEGFCGNDTLVQQVTVNIPPTAGIDVDPIEDCSPTTINIDNLSTGFIDDYEWSLNGNVQSTDSAYGPLNYNLPPGNNPLVEDISLTVSNTCGSSTDNATITVNPPTLASFNVTPLEVCLGEEITVTDNSLGVNLNVNYDFGDGNTSNTSGPHTLNYATDGDYTIELIAEGLCGNDTLSQLVTVHPFPIADFDTDVQDGCEPLQIEIINNSTTGANYQWDFGPNANPQTSTDENPGTVVFTGSNLEEISVVVEENGCESFDTSYVQIYPLPEIDFTLDPTVGCTPTEVEITNSSQDNGTETFEWDFGNGNTFTGYAPPNETYVAPVLNDTTFDIVLTVTSGDNCADSLTQSVTINPTPIAEFTFLSDTICLDETMEITNLSQGAVNYEWDFGDGNTSPNFEPSHNYTSAGTFTVSLIAYTSFSCSDTITAEIVVHPTPVSDFSNTTECEGFITEFSDESTGNIVDWQWDFDDGNTSTDQNPNNLYASEGNYNATLVVTNNFGCTDQSTNSVLVNTVPEANFSAENFCLNDQTSFTDETIGVTTQVEWDFGDGNTSTDQNPTHTYASTGVYQVTLVAFGGSGCTDTIVDNVEITPIPGTEFSAIDTCLNDITIFTDETTGGPDSYDWDFGDGNSSTDQNPTHLYASDGLYNVTLTTTFSSSGCSSSFSENVIVHERTSPSFSVNTPCLNAASEFIDETTNDPVIWEWNFDDGNTSAQQNPTNVYGTPGDYDVTLITANSFGCLDTVVQEVTVFPLPVADFDYDTVCLNAETNFTDASTDAIDWSYDFGDGNTSNGVQSPSHLYNNDGTYNVSLVVENIHGCTDTTTNSIIVNPNPEADFSADTACFSYPTSFTDESINAVAWNWDFVDNGATSTNQSPTHVFSEDGLFDVELIVENVFGCTDTAVFETLVLPQPTADFENTNVCAGNSVDFTNTSLGTPNDFSWDFGDGSPISTDENPTHTYTTGGIYNITYIVGNNSGCADTLVEPIEVFTVPDVDFEADTVCYLSITSFDNLTQDPTPIADWDWDFGDGNTSFQEDPTYIYQAPGVYNVTLTATNQNGCFASHNQDVVVSDVPEADFDANVVCFGSPTTFTDQSTGFPIEWIWDFGDGTVINGGPNEQHTYAAPGSYVVSLLVIGGGGACNDQTFEIVTVDDEANASMDIPSEVCDGQSVFFESTSTATVGAIDTYDWDMGDGSTYTDPTGNHTYASPGTYQVTLTVTTTDGCSNSVTEEIEVLPNPAADFTSAFACSGQETQFSDLSTGNNTNWVWNFGDGSSSNEQNPVHAYNNHGNYNVTLTITNNDGCQSNVTEEITVYASPNSAFITDEVCYGDETNFTDQSSIPSGDIVDWNWNFGATEGSSNDQNPSHTFDTYDDSFEVTLVTTSDEGCTDSLTQIVNLRPIVDFDITPDNASGCQELTVQFSNQSQATGGANVISWDWDFGDGFNSFLEEPEHVFTEPGNYTITLTATTDADCQLEYETPYEVEVYPLPIPGFRTEPDEATIVYPLIDVIDESIDAMSYIYYFGDGFYTNDANPSHEYSDIGTYEITQIVQSEYGCVDSTSLAVRITDDLTFYAPNAFTPDGDGRNDVYKWSVRGHDSFQIIIFNRWGEEVFKTDDEFDYWDGTYHGKPVKEGVYVYRVIIWDQNDDWHRFDGHITVIR